MSTHLTMIGYSQMSLDEREVFDAWLRANGIGRRPGPFLVAVVFGEGFIDGECAMLDDRDWPQFAEEGVAGSLKTEWRRVPVASPPPPFVFAYCVAGSGEMVQ